MLDRPHQTPSYSPAEIARLRAEIATIEKVVAQSNNAMVVGQMLAEVFGELGKANFAEVEKLLRETGSRIFLVARALSIFGDRFDSKIPGGSESFEYALWICMNGREEAMAILRQDKISPEQNEVNLEACGFLMPRPG